MPEVTESAGCVAPAMRQKHSPLREAFDVGRLCRGLIATIRVHDLYGKRAEVAMDSVDMQVVVDAKDVHDKTNSDTTSFGAQKSLAFVVCLASLRASSTKDAAEVDIN